MKIKVIYEGEIDRCKGTCPYFSLDGGPGPVMVCMHPDSPDGGRIISHPVCDYGFPEKCPLLKDPVIAEKWKRFLKEPCDHNLRTRYTTGFRCNDKCGKYFDKSSSTYRKGEHMSNLWCSLHNFNARRGQEGVPVIAEIEIMKNKIGIGIKHENYEELIAGAEVLLGKYKE